MEGSDRVRERRAAEDPSIINRAQTKACEDLRHFTPHQFIAALCKFLCCCRDILHCLLAGTSPGDRRTHTIASQILLGTEFRTNS